MFKSAPSFSYQLPIMVTINPNKRLQKTVRGRRRVCLTIAMGNFISSSEDRLIVHDIHHRISYRISQEKHEERCKPHDIKQSNSIFYCGDFNNIKQALNLVSESLPEEDRKTFIIHYIVQAQGKINIILQDYDEAALAQYLKHHHPPSIATHKHHTYNKYLNILLDVVEHQRESLQETPRSCLIM